MDAEAIREFLTYILWNELFSGQSEATLETMAKNFGLPSPGEQLSGCYLVLSGIERSVYRRYGMTAGMYIQALDDPLKVLAFRLQEMGFRMLSQMIIYSDEKLLVFVLTPTRAQQPIHRAAQLIQNVLQNGFEAGFPAFDRQNGCFTVYDPIPKTGVEAVYQSFVSLWELHRLRFFPLSQRVMVQGQLETLKISHPVAELKKDISILVEALRNREAAHVWDLFDHTVLPKLKESLDRELCYETMSELCRLLQENCDIFDLDMEIPSPLSCSAYTRLTPLAENMRKLLQQQLALLSTSRRHYHLLIRSAVAYIKRQETRDITLQELADYLAVSAQYLSRIWNQDMGVGLPQYLLTLKIKDAQHLLTQTKLTIQEIAQQSGFPNAPYFCRCFKKQTGMTPKMFRQAKDTKTVSTPQ